MNDANLIPMNKRSGKEASTFGKRGGVASGVSRRKKKQIKTLITELLNGEPDPMETIGMLDIPFDGELTNAALLVKALYDKAKAGDVKAFETIMKYSGEDPDQKRKDAELKLKRELLLQTRKADLQNDKPVKIVFDVPDTEPEP